MTPAEDIEEAPAHLSPEAARAYVDAPVQGLCHEGALEVALGVERTVAADAARLDAVEFKIAHLERAVLELSDVLYRHQQQLDSALAMNQALRQQLEEIEGRTTDATSKLRYMPAQTDIRPGDRLLTSGIDRVYPAGIAVARVSRVSRSQSSPYLRVECLPLAGLDRSRTVLVLIAEPQVPPQ